MDENYCSKCKEFKSDFANWDCFKCGRTEQAKRDREAVEELLVNADIDSPKAIEDIIEHNMAINEALRALDAAKPEEK